MDAQRNVYAFNRYRTGDVISRFSCRQGDTKTSLASVDENLYAANVDVSERAMEDLVLEFKLVRQSTEKLLENLTEDQSKAIGDPDANPISARAVACLLIGHSLHHIQVLQERYF